MNHKFATALILLTFFAVTSSRAAVLYSFWSFDTFTSGDGAFTTAVTAETMPGTPTISYAGSSLLSSGGSTFTAFNGTTWTGSNGSATPGHSLGWSSGSTGNSFSITLDTTGLESLQVAMSIRSYTGGLTSFSSLEYNTGSGFVSSGLSLSPFSTSTSFVNYSLDLSSLTAINNQSSVTLRWTLASIPNNTSVRIDNIQLSASTVPEPSALALFALGIGLFLLRRRRTTLA